MIQTVFSIHDISSWADELDRLTNCRRRRPFDAASVDFVSEVSRQLLRLPEVKEFPELAALAHWFRPSSVKRMAMQLSEGAVRSAIRPRGLVFALAPANVDVLFIYGWFLSLLAGNATIVRVSQKPSRTRDVFLNLVSGIGENEVYHPVLNDSWIVSYPHNDQITGKISGHCHARLIWGGDATVSAIRAIRLKPTAVEGGFADRFSLAAFDACTLLAADGAQIAELARRFANDSLWFDQQACSSPRCLYWIGSSGDVEEARKRFWSAFELVSQRFENPPAAIMARVTDLFVMAAGGMISRVETPFGALPARGWAGERHHDVREVHSGFGTFVEHRLEAFSEIAKCLDDKDQTLVVHGIDPKEVDALMDVLPNRSLDRIVPPGQATDFATTWDGTNLFDLLTRRVSLLR